MTRRMLRVAMAGLAAAAIATPAWADHVAVGSGFMEHSAWEWHGPRIFNPVPKGPVGFRGGSDVTPAPRRPDVPPGQEKKDKGDKGFFDGEPTVVLPDVTAPLDPGAGFGGQDLSGGPTASTPEPGTLLLLGAGLGGALLHRARRRQSQQA